MSKWERRPPCSLEAERAILGAILLDEKAIFGAQGKVSVADFYVEFHRITFEAMIRLHTAQKAIDLITLKDELESHGDQLGPHWVTDLMELTVGLPRSVNIEHYAEIVREKSKLRHTIQAASETMEAAFQGELPACEIAEDLGRSLQNIIGSGSRDFQSSSEIVSRVYSMIEKRSQDKRFVTGIASGITELDRLTAGFHEEELIIVAARPGVGKTSLMMNITKYAAVHESKKVAVFSLEMSMEQLILRFIAEESGISLGKVRTGFVDKKDWPFLAQAAGRISDAPIFICDSSQLEKLTVPMLSGKAHRLKESHGIDMIVVDYLQLLSGKAENRTQEITQISRELKRMAAVLKVPVIAASQLNRAIEMNKGRRPQLSDLRESGSIEQDADVVIFIHQDNQDKQAIIPTELIVGKQRNGPQDTVNVQFNRALTRFENIAEGENLGYGT